MAAMSIRIFVGVPFVSLLILTLSVNAEEQQPGRYVLHIVAYNIQISDVSLWNRPVLFVRLVLIHYLNQSCVKVIIVVLSFESANYKAVRVHSYSFVILYMYLSV